jgi:hypothetical protein
VAPCRVQWDAVFFNWWNVFHPSGTQCYQLFDWVLDVTEWGPPDDADWAAGVEVRVYTLADARLDIFYVEWPDRDVIALVDLLSW